MVQSAVIKQIGDIGEATKNLSKEFKQKYKNISWQKIISMRNTLVHEYFRIDTEILWNTVQESIPDLKKKILEILKS